MWGVGVVKGRRIRCRECTNNVDIWIVCAVKDKRCIAMYVSVVVSVALEHVGLSWDISSAVIA